MNRLLPIIAAGSLVLLGAWFAPTAVAEEFVYEGQWNTTNRKLDGEMTCVVRQVSDEKWSGRFYGVWQGVSFDYTVAFAGPPANLSGSATIDGASYEWKGEFTEDSPRRFRATFGGSRYAGYFDLKEKKIAK